MKKRAKLSYKIQPACLPSIHEYESKAWAVGWGLTNQTGQNSNILKNVKLEILENDYCRSISSTRLCAGNKLKHKIEKFNKN